MCQTALSACVCSLDFPLILGKQNKQDTLVVTEALSEELIMKDFFLFFFYSKEKLSEIQKCWVLLFLFLFLFFYICTCKVSFNTTSS